MTSAGVRPLASLLCAMAVGSTPDQRLALIALKICPLAHSYST